MTRRLYRMMMMSFAMITLTAATGCTDNLFRNIWVGFGESIGALPGSIAANFVAETLGVTTN